MSLAEDVDTLHRWLRKRSTPVYWLLWGWFTFALIMAFGLAMEWPTRLGPPAVWIADALVLVLFWASHVRYRFKEPDDDR